MRFSLCSQFCARKFTKNTTLNRGGEGRGGEGRGGEGKNNIANVPIFCLGVVV